MHCQSENPIQQSLVTKGLEENDHIRQILLIGMMLLSFSQLVKQTYLLELHPFPLFSFDVDKPEHGEFSNETTKSWDCQGGLYYHYIKAKL